jgi:hypothetical protein
VQTIGIRIIGRRGSVQHELVMKLSSSYLLSTAPAQTHRLTIRRIRYNVLQRATTKLTVIRLVTDNGDAVGCQDSLCQLLLISKL